jgi:hypothetical protein
VVHSVRDALRVASERAQTCFAQLTLDQLEVSRHVLHGLLFSLLNQMDGIQAFANWYSEQIYRCKGGQYIDILVVGFGASSIVQLEYVAPSGLCDQSTTDSATRHRELLALTEGEFLNQQVKLSGNRTGSIHDYRYTRTYSRYEDRFHGSLDMSVRFGVIGLGPRLLVVDGPYIGVHPKHGGYE